MAGEIMGAADRDCGGALTPVLHGSVTSAVACLVAKFYGSVATIFEEWGTYRKPELPRRAYRGDAMALVHLPHGRDLAR